MCSFLSVGCQKNSCIGYTSVEGVISSPMQSEVHIFLRICLESARSIRDSKIALERNFERTNALDESEDNQIGPQTHKCKSSAWKSTWSKHNRIKPLRSFAPVGATLNRNSDRVHTIGGPRPQYKCSNWNKNEIRERHNSAARNAVEWLPWSAGSGWRHFLDRLSRELWF